MNPPIEYGIHEFQQIILLDEFDWDLSKNLFQISSMEEEYRTSSNFHFCMNVFDIIIPSAPKTVQCIYDTGVHQFDKLMTNVSIGISQDLMVDILIRNVRDRITRSGYATYTDNQHREISADLLASQWGIGLYKSKLSLQSTTQDNEKSSLKPPTR